MGKTIKIIVLDEQGAELGTLISSELLNVDTIELVNNDVKTTYVIVEKKWIFSPEKEQKNIKYSMRLEADFVVQLIVKTK